MSAKKNSELWNEVFITDPEFVKPISGKQYSGNSPKPYWIVQRATEVFGPCGIGWGFTVPSERVERFGLDAIHIAHVRVWYEWGGKRGEIEQMGQTKMAYTTNSGRQFLDEDAPKKSVTDAMVKCLSLIGFAGDIFSGRWDDSGYIQLASEETRLREEGAACMSAAQVEELLCLAAKSNTDMEAFMAWISKGVGRKCSTLSEVPANAFEPAKLSLEKKLKSESEQPKNQPQMEPA